MAASGPGLTFALASCDGWAGLLATGALSGLLTVLAGFAATFLLFGAFPGLLVSLGMLCASVGIMRSRVNNNLVASGSGISKFSGGAGGGHVVSRVCVARQARVISPVSFWTTLRPSSSSASAFNRVRM